MPFDAYIVDCVRTAGGKKKGRLSKWHPSDLGAAVCDALVDRNGIPGGDIDDVIMGCVTQIGAQAANLGRSCVLAAKKIPESVPGTTVDRQCGSSQQALHFAAQAVMSGTQDMVIAGGVEVMSLCNIGSNIIEGIKAGKGHPQGPSINKRYKTQFSQFKGAELLAAKYNISREELDRFAVLSHEKAVEAQKRNAFKNEIIPLQGRDKKTGATVTHDADEGVRPGTTYERVSQLKPLAKGGRITAANASQICDGASAILVCNERAVKKYNLKPRAKIVSLGLAGSCPVVMLEGPIPATRHALRRANMSIDDIDLYEVNEAFAPVPLAWAKATGAKIEKLNVHGGAMALGHPLGATGTKLMGTLINALEQRGLQHGLLAICEGGGTANATIVKLVNDVEPNSKL